MRGDIWKTHPVWAKLDQKKKKTSLYISAKQTSEAADILWTSSVASIKITGARRANLDAQGPHATLSVSDYSILKNCPQTRGGCSASSPAPDGSGKPGASTRRGSKRKVGRSGQIIERQGRGWGGGVEQCGRDQASEPERQRLHNKGKEETATSARSWSSSGADGEA